MAYEPESSSSPRERRGQYIFSRLDHHSEHHAQPSIHSVTTDSETCTLKTYRNPHQWPVIPLGYQVCLRLLILTLSALVSAALIYLIIIRSSTGDSRHLDREGHNVPAWPATVWMQPTFVLLGAAAFCTLGNFSFLIAECSKVGSSPLVHSPSDTAQFGRRWLGSKAAWIASLCIVCMIAAWIIATAYAKTFGATNTFASDLWSWSCARKDVQLNYGNSRIGFVKLCQYMVGLQ